MTAGDYIAALASIIVALAVTDLAHSMHRLLRARKHVRWDWLPLAVALLILLTTLQFWWVFFDVWRSSTEFALGGFLPDFISLLLLFFCASAALPDECPSEGIDLKAYYLENRTYFWSLFLLLAVSADVAVVSRQASTGMTITDIVRLRLTGGNLPLIAISVVLIVTKNRWVHAGLILFMLAAVVSTWAALTISG